MGPIASGDNESHGDFSEFDVLPLQDRRTTQEATINQALNALGYRNDGLADDVVQHHWEPIYPSSVGFTENSGLTQELRAYVNNNTFYVNDIAPGYDSNETRLFKMGMKIVGGKLVRIV